MEVVYTETVLKNNRKRRKRNWVRD